MKKLMWGDEEIRNKMKEEFFVRKISRCVTWIEKGLNKHGIFSDVNEESFWWPVAHELYERGGDAMFRKGSSTSRSHRLATDISFEILMKSCDEEITSRNFASRC